MLAIVEMGELSVKIIKAGVIMVRRWGWEVLGTEYFVDTSRTVYVIFRHYKQSKD